MKGNTMNDLQRKILGTYNINFMSTTRVHEYVDNGETVRVAYWETVRNVKDIDDDYLSERQVVAIIPHTESESIQGYGDTIGVSNHRSLLRDYEDQLVVVSWSDSEALGIVVNRLLDDGETLPEWFDEQRYLVDDIVNLSERHPLYDESDHSEVEFEIIEEGINDYLVADIVNAAYRKHGMDIKDEDAFWYLCDRMETNGDYPFVEQLGAVYDTDAVARHIAGHNEGLWVKVKRWLGFRVSL